MAIKDSNQTCEICGVSFIRNQSQLKKHVYCSPACYQVTRRGKPSSRMAHLTGQRFGKLKVIEFLGVKYRQTQWKCVCDCGNFTVASVGNLRNGHTKACGSHNGMQTHGMYQSLEYKIWTSMKSRCLNQNDKAYKYYGERGITVCERWRHSFENFIADMGVRSSGNLSIERIDNDKGYSPDNCVWANKTVQSRNHRRNFQITFNGETLCVTDWAVRLGMEPQTLSNRIQRYGWSIEKAFSTPVGKRRR